MIFLVGKGVFALRDFSKGEFLLEYAGELLRFAEGRKRMKDYPLNLGSYIYLFSFKDKQFWYVFIRLLKINSMFNVT